MVSFYFKECRVWIFNQSTATLWKIVFDIISISQHYKFLGKWNIFFGNFAWGWISIFANSLAYQVLKWFCLQSKNLLLEVEKILKIISLLFVMPFSMVDSRLCAPGTRILDLKKINLHVNNLFITKIKIKHALLQNCLRLLQYFSKTSNTSNTNYSSLQFMSVSLLRFL